MCLIENILERIMMHIYFSAFVYIYFYEIKIIGNQETYLYSIFLVGTPGVLQPPKGLPLRCLPVSLILTLFFCFTAIPCMLQYFSFVTLNAILISAPGYSCKVCTGWSLESDFCPK